jgi:hypothetical protein
MNDRIDRLGRLHTDVPRQYGKRTPWPLWSFAGALLVVPLAVAWQAADVPDNRARLEAMAPADLADLRRNKKIFDAMSEEERERVRALDQRLHQEPNVGELRAIWRDYNRWLGQLDAETKISIINLKDVDERVQTISRIVAQRRQRGLAAEDRLPEGDWPAFTQWLKETGSAKLKELRQSNPDLPREFNPNDWRILRTPVPQSLDDEDFERLAARLSPPGVAILEGKPDREEKTRLVIGWWVSTFLQVSSEELQRFLKELPSATRLYIEQLGPEQGQQELKRRYFDDLRRRQR